MDEEDFRLNAPFGARCFMTSLRGDSLVSAFGCLNAPFGARCFMTVRRVIPCVTTRNRQPDRQQLKKHPSNLQAQDQNISVFVAAPRIATNVPLRRAQPGNEGDRSACRHANILAGCTVTFKLMLRKVRQ